MKTGIIFPSQLIENNLLVKNCNAIYLVEEFLYFKQYKFHKQKIAFHRASMKAYQNYLHSLGIQVNYINSNDELADIRKLIPYLKSIGVTQMEYIDTVDNWLEQRINKTCHQNNLLLIKHPSPIFLNTSRENENFFANRKRMFQTDFYKYQRQSKNILLAEDQKPIGGKWTFDEENRLKYPKGKKPPTVDWPVVNIFYEEAIVYTERNFPDNYGELNTQCTYPVTFAESKKWLKDFLKTRFAEFGPYEDAIVSNQSILNHSVLSPMLNVGLLTPDYLLSETIAYAEAYNVPINSVEGFVRQILGWREFIRAVYELKGSEERTTNYWGFTRKIPQSFYNGTTGIVPIDLTIQKILKTGYCHHIERLMVLGNFMLLCEFDPDEVYRWFMELFMDAYDWVMVPNIYGMSQFADGGLMSTKPYISGSNYLMKMSDYPKGEWQQIWDGLFWRFMHTHRAFFIQNPRLSMLLASFDKMSDAKKQSHLLNADNFLFAL